MSGEEERMLKNIKKSESFRIKNPINKKENEAEESPSEILLGEDYKRLEDLLSTYEKKDLFDETRDYFNNIVKNTWNKEVVLGIIDILKNRFTADDGDFIENLVFKIWGVTESTKRDSSSLDLIKVLKSYEDVNQMDNALEWMSHIRINLKQTEKENNAKERATSGVIEVIDILSNYEDSKLRNNILDSLGESARRDKKRPTNSMMVLADVYKNEVKELTDRCKNEDFIAYIVNGLSQTMWFPEERETLSKLINIYENKLKPIHADMEGLTTYAFTKCLATVAKYTNSEEMILSAFDMTKHYKDELTVKEILGRIEEYLPYYAKDQGYTFDNSVKDRGNNLLAQERCKEVVSKLFDLFSEEFTEIYDLITDPIERKSLGYLLHDMIVTGDEIDNDQILEYAKEFKKQSNRIVKIHEFLYDYDANKTTGFRETCLLAHEKGILTEYITQIEDAIKSGYSLEEGMHESLSEVLV